MYDTSLDVSVLAKFADAFLIKITYRVIISKKTHSINSGQAGDRLEVKKRSSKETKFISLEELLKMIQLSH